MKYIILEDENGMILPIIFPERLIHSEVSRAIQRVARKNLNSFYEPVSAGFVEIKDCTVHGKSETLNLKPKQFDNIDIRMSEGFGGMSYTSLPSNLQLKLRELLDETN